MTAATDAQIDARSHDFHRAAVAWIAESGESDNLDLLDRCPMGAHGFRTAMRTLTRWGLITARISTDRSRLIYSLTGRGEAAARRWAVSR